MTQAKPERHPRRGSENRQRTAQAAVRFTEAEHAALAEASQRTGKTEPAFLRLAFLAYISEGYVPPLAAQVRAWLRDHGWIADPSGPAGALWHKVGKHPVKAGVGVPHTEGDERVIWGAVERIARCELRAVADVAIEMLAIPEVPGD